MTSKDLKICIVGASGRMGQELVRIAKDIKFPGIDRIFFVAGIVDAADPKCGSLMPEVEQPLASTWQESFNETNIIIDFSSQTGTRLAIEAAVARGIPLVSGTTGLSAQTQYVVVEASQKIPVLRATNFSVGVNLLYWLVEKTTAMLGPGYDIEIMDLHHRLKKDSPSGTAISLAEAAARARDTSHEAVTRCARAGSHVPRSEKEIGVFGLRGGAVVGEHTVFFLGNEERLELTHRAQSRGVFANGALRAAAWLFSKTPGLYSMQDVLQSQLSTK